MSDKTGRIGGSNASLSMRQAAAYLGCSYFTLARHYRRDWNIKSYRVSNRVRFLVRHLDSFIESRTED